MIAQSRLRLRSGRTLVNGVCVARTTIRQARRVVCTCRWPRGVRTLCQWNVTELASARSQIGR